MSGEENLWHRKMKIILFKGTQKMQSETKIGKIVKQHHDDDHKHQNQQQNYAC
jgi:hypothetical protein